LQNRSNAILGEREIIAAAPMAKLAARTLATRTAERMGLGDYALIFRVLFPNFEGASE